MEEKITHKSVVFNREIPTQLGHSLPVGPKPGGIPEGLADKFRWLRSRKKHGRGFEIGERPWFDASMQRLIDSLDEGGTFSGLEEFFKTATMAQCVETVVDVVDHVLDGPPSTQEAAYRSALWFLLDREAQLTTLRRLRMPTGK